MDKNQNEYTINNIIIYTILIGGYMNNYCHFTIDIKHSSTEEYITLNKLDIF